MNDRLTSKGCIHAIHLLFQVGGYREAFEILEKKKARTVEEEVLLGRTIQYHAEVWDVVTWQREIIKSYHRWIEDGASLPFPQNAVINPLDGIKHMMVGIIQSFQIQKYMLFRPDAAFGFVKRGARRLLERLKTEDILSDEAKRKLFAEETHGNAPQLPIGSE